MLLADRQVLGIMFKKIRTHLLDLLSIPQSEGNKIFTQRMDVFGNPRLCLFIDSTISV